MKRRSNHFAQHLIHFGVALALLLSLLPGSVLTARAVSPNIVISQVYGGGGNTGATYTHDFIELFNRGATTVSLAGWSVQYASATGIGNFGATTTQITELPGVSLAPGQYLLIQEAQGTGGTTPLPAPDVTDASPIAMSATGGKVALVNTTTPLGCNGGSTPCSPAALATIVDLVGWDGANFFETAPAPATTNTTSIFRINNGCTDTDNNSTDFTAGSPVPHNTASPLNPCEGNTPVIANCGGPLSTFEGQAASRAVSASDEDGTVVSILINSITPTDPGTITLSGLIPSPGVGGAATANVDVSAATPPGTYSVEIVATNDDPTPQTGTCTLTVTVQDILPIGAVQGVVNDADNGLLSRSPFAPPSGNSAGAQFVIVQGVIYQKTLARTSSGGNQNGFFLQNTAATADGDPNTSDGIFVFMGGFTSLIGGYVPVVGDEVIIRARVTEFFFLTELTSASALQVVRSGVDLAAELPALETDPPDDLAEANRYWERREGMRVQIPSGSVVIDSRDVFAGTADGEVWVARGDSDIAQRADPYARRAFRDPHPLDNDPALFDDGNGYRIIMGSLGIKFAAGDNTELIAPARTFDTLDNAPVGGVYFSFNKYQVMVEQQLDLTPGVDPALNAPPQPFDLGEEYSLAIFNVENLYDFRDDPFDGCDFTGNSGCPGVNPPFDYVPASDAAYQARLTEIAQQFVGDLHSPDIILAQEAEDQDICTVAGGALACGTVNNADGKPDTLQELATRIADLGGASYDAAFDRDGADDRGIISAYLFRTDRVELLPAPANDPVLGSSPTVIYRGTPLSYNTDVQNPKALNADLPDDVDLSTGVDGSNVFTRPPQVGLFRVWRNGIGASVFTDLYISDNHFSSTPNARVGQRQEQSLYNAKIVAALQAAGEDVRVVVGGDLNVYPRPDDPFVPGEALFPSDQLAALYDQGLTNLFGVLVGEVSVTAYGYIFQGQTQTLDQIFVTPSVLADLVQVRIAHINSDFPADYDGDGPRGTSDHDPNIARYDGLPTLDKLEALVNYYDANGAITGNNTTKNLIDRLERARRYFERGQMSAYRDQLQAFIDQVQDFTPQFITPAASSALVQETSILLAIP